MIDTGTKEMLPGVRANIESCRGRALAGVVIATGALAATYGYVTWRGGDRKVRFGHELVLPTVIGGLPGVVLYYALVKGRRFHVKDQGAKRR